MRKHLPPLTVMAISLLSLSSCYCDKYVVGNVDPDEPLVHVASMHNQHFLCGLVVNHQRAKAFVPGVENYVIESKHTFWDAVVTSVTCGIYTPTTTKFYVPRSNPRVESFFSTKSMSKAYRGYLKEK